MPEHGKSEPDPKAVREQLDRILRSGPFRQSRRRQRLLEYIVSETLAGRGDRLKGYNIALEVFDRPTTFDPSNDPIVRMEVGRLRDRLREYYDADGQADHVRIELPKGSYTPTIECRQDAELDAADATAREQIADPLQDANASGEEKRANRLLNPGESLGSRVDSGQAMRSPALAGPDWKRQGMLAVAVLLFFAGSYWLMNGRGSGPTLPDKPSIAVLPFDNIGDDPKWERFADGITEDIITDLAHSKDLIVIARNSTGVYKGRPIDIRVVGRDLNVKYVLEGSIQLVGERIRVSAQLIEAASGSHAWSERYDRPLDDLFAVQSDVTERIAATLIGYEGAVADAERRLIRRKPPASLSAYDIYLLGLEAKHKVTKESLTEAEGLFRRALELDPQLARAYCGLATVQSYLIDLGLAPSVEEAVQKMSDAAQAAVKLDPDDGLTHQVLGMAYGYQGKAEQSLVELNRAESLAPSDADLLLIIAWSLPAFGQSERAVSLAERSLKLNPHYPDWYNQGLSLVYFFGEQYTESLKYRLLVKEPVALDYAFAAAAYAYLGRMTEADSAAANAKKLDPSWSVERYLSDAGGYAEKEAELFVEGARKSGLSTCVPPDKLKDSPNLIRVKSCDQRRARMSD